MGRKEWGRRHWLWAHTVCAWAQTSRHLQRRAACARPSGRCSYPGPPSVGAKRVEASINACEPASQPACDHLSDSSLSGSWAKTFLVFGGGLRAATVCSPGQPWPYFGKTCGGPRQHGDARAYRCRLCGPAAVHAIHGAIIHDARARARARTHACQF